VTLAFAKSLVEIERLGRGGGPDLLALGLSATDLVGHFYGPESWESRDALARLDQMLGDFFDFLEREVGKDRFVVVLTADHGVLPIPEWLQEQGRSRCPVPGGRVDFKPLVAALEKRLDEAFPQATAHTDSSWFRALGGRLTLDRRRTRGDDALEIRVMAVATTFLESQPGIERVWSSEEVLGGEGPEPMATWYRNAWVPGITGDLAVQVAEDCLLGDRGLGTSHGSPYGYDRKVPLVFMGPDIEAGRVFDQPASPVDIAPTLAHYLELSAPVGLDGQVLKLKER
jgi:arylsulfatase A-like enzyme